MLRLPEPMLARAAPIPNGRGWLFEPKLDGFRCLVCTHGRLRVRSRRGWDMTKLLPELTVLPPNVQLDGELVALDGEGLPDFHRLGSRLSARPERHRGDVLRLRRSGRGGIGDHDAPLRGAARATRRT